MPSTATAALAIASASAVGESENASMTRMGSGKISTAPIAVKWCETIASVSNSAATSVVRISSLRTALASAAAPNTMPSPTETVTSGKSQAMRPGTSSAHMPV
jgi:hypothetical protein